VLDRGPASVVVDVGGVGLLVSIPERTAGSLPDDGREILLHTHLNVRETALELYGFATMDDRAMFQALIGVSGIGPRTALAVLSRMSADAIARALQTRDVDAFCRAPGVGKKTAQRVVLELSERFDMHEETVVATGAGVAAVQDAIRALIALGYGDTQARKAVSSVRPTLDPDVTASTLIREALVGLGASAPAR